MISYSYLVLVDMLGIGTSLDEHFGDIDSLTDKERRVTLRVLDVDVCAVLEQVCDQLLVSVGCRGMSNGIQCQKTGRTVSTNESRYSKFFQIKCRDGWAV